MKPKKRSSRKMINPIALKKLWENCMELEAYIVDQILHTVFIC